MSLQYGFLKLFIGSSLAALSPWELGMARLDVVVRIGKIIQRLLLEQVLWLEASL